MVSATAVYAWLGITPSKTASLDLVTSPVFSPLVLGITRIVIGLYALSTTCIVLAHDSITSSKHDAGWYVILALIRVPWKAAVTVDFCRYFSYFTDLSYIGVVAYYFASGVQTLAFSRNLRRGVEGYPLQRWSRFLQFLHRLLGSTITTFRKFLLSPVDDFPSLNWAIAIIVTVVYWSLLASSSTFATTFSSTCLVESQASKY